MWAVPPEHRTAMAQEEGVQRGPLTCPWSHGKGGGFVLKSVPDWTQHRLKASHLPSLTAGGRRD